MNASLFNRGRVYNMPDIQYNTDRFRCDSQIFHSLSSRLHQWSCRSKPAHPGWGLYWCRWCRFRLASLRSEGVARSSVAWETIGFLRRKRVEKHPKQQSQKKAWGRLEVNERWFASLPWQWSANLLMLRNSIFGSRVLVKSEKRKAINEGCAQMPWRCRYWFVLDDADGAIPNEVSEPDMKSTFAPVVKDVETMALVSNPLAACSLTVYSVVSASPSRRIHVSSASKISS